MSDGTALCIASTNSFRILCRTKSLVFIMTISRVGIGIAKELIYTCRQVKADEAVSIGLANKIVDETKLMDEAKDMMKMILSRSPLAISYCKTAINRGFDTDIRNGLEIEKECWAVVFGTEDKKEGIEAFLEKRAPQFPSKMQ